MSIGVVGKPIDRVDGRLKVTGAAQYAADAPLRDVAHAVLVESVIARGKIASIDVAPAQRAPGVLTIVTHLNAPKLQMPKPDFMTGGVPGEFVLPLADDVIRYAGQKLAVVVADTLENARRAAELLRVSCAAEPAVTSAADAGAKAESPADWFGEDPQYERGDVDAALAALPEGAQKIEAVYHTPSETHNPMEPGATVASWSGDQLTLYDSTQWIVGVQAIVSECFGLPRQNVRVVCPFVGGAFGCKAFIWPHVLLTAMAAKVANRPVKLVLTRPQMFTTLGHRPSTTQRLTLAAERSGKLLAIRHQSEVYTSRVNEYIEVCGLASSRFVYACENVATPHRLYRLDVPPPTFMRAPGETPGMFALESAIDELAYALKLDPLELRRINHTHVNPAGGRPWSSNHLKACYDMGAARFGWEKRAAAVRATRDGEMLLGWGCATATFPGLRFVATVRVRAFPDGRIEAGSATHDLGTGAYTVFTQVTADALGVPFERVTFKLGDSTLPPAPVAGGSNSTATVSSSIVEACNALYAKLVQAAIADANSPLHGMKPADVGTGGGRVFAKSDPTRGQTIEQILTAAGAPLEASGTALPGAEMGQFAFQSFGAHFCEVSVDELLGRVRVTRFVSAMDIGRVLNPKTAASQIQGGVVMGIGMALSEHSVMDHRTGRFVTDNLADYAVPVNADVRSLEVLFTDKPDPHINTLGCRGAGEIGITGVAAAIANAVYHATGKRLRDLPITPEKLLA